MRKTGDARAQALIKEQQPSTLPKDGLLKAVLQMDSRTVAGSPHAAENQTGPSPSPPWASLTTGVYWACAVLSGH